MSTTADIRNGAVISFKNARMKIVEFQHVKPGKGPAFVRTNLKNFNIYIRMEIASFLWITIPMIRFRLIKY